MKFRFFREDLCDRCGICFERCPVLELASTEAKKDIEALINGKTGASLAYQRCTTCYTCDLVCPVQAHPYELILERWGEEHQLKGMPALARLVFPNEPSNMWASVRALMPEDELSLLRSWQENVDHPKKVMLLTGFYTNLVPFIAMTSLIDELRPAIAGFEGFWGCGGDAYKLGMLDEAEMIGKMLHKQLSDMGVQKLYCLMGAEAMMLGDVMPSRFGIDFSFCDPEPLDCWILDRLRTGNIKVKQKLNRKVAVHDNCLSKYKAGKLQDTVRQTMDYIGCEMVEMAHNRQSALCCGWAATIPALHGEFGGSPLHTLLYLLHSLYLRLQEAEATGAEVMVVNCHACYLFLSLMRVLTGSNVDIYLSLELVQMAAGETPVRRNERRAWDMMAIVSNLLLRWLFYPKERRRFSPRPIRMEPIPPLSPADASRLRFFAKIYRSSLVQNQPIRKLLGVGVKTLIDGYRRFLFKKQRELFAGV